MLISNTLVTLSYKDSVMKNCLIQCLGYVTNILWLCAVMASSLLGVKKLSGPLGHRRISDPYTPDTPQLINPNQFQGKTLQSIYADNTYTLVLCNDNSLCLGESRAGQLGLGHTNNQHTPRQINPNCFQGKTIQYIYKGNLHNLALCQDGTLLGP